MTARRRQSWPAVALACVWLAAGADPDPCGDIGDGAHLTDRGGAWSAYTVTPPPDASGAGREDTISALWLLDATGTSPLRFRPAGQVHAGGGRMDLLSPAGRYAVLPQDRYGPYHIVATARLPAYLGADAAPDAVLQWRADSGFVGTHTAPAWHAERTGSFLVRCCGETRVVTFDLDRPAPDRLRHADAADRADRLEARLKGRHRPVGRVSGRDDKDGPPQPERDIAPPDGYAFFGDNLRWPDNRLCDTWSLRPLERIPAEDRALRAHIDGARGALVTWVSLSCDGRPVGRLFVAERGSRLRFASRIGATGHWRVWRPAPMRDDPAGCAATPLAGPTREP